MSRHILISMPTIQKKHAYHSNRVKLAVHFERKQESVIHHLHNNLQIGWVKRNLESFEVEALSLLRKNKHIS